MGDFDQLVHDIGSVQTMLAQQMAETPSFDFGHVLHMQPSAMQSHLSWPVDCNQAAALTIQGGSWQDVQRGTWLGQEPSWSGASTRHGAMAVNRSEASGIDALSSRCIKVGLVRPHETAYKKILGAGILPGFRAGNADPVNS